MEKDIKCNKCGLILSKEDTTDYVTITIPNSEGMLETKHLCKQCEEKLKLAFKSKPLSHVDRIMKLLNNYLQLNIK